MQACDLCLHEHLILAKSHSLPCRKLVPAFTLYLCNDAIDACRQAYESKLASGSWCKCRGVGVCQLQSVPKRCGASREARTAEALRTQAVEAGNTSECVHTNWLKYPIVCLELSLSCHLRHSTASFPGSVVAVPPLCDTCALQTFASNRPEQIQLEGIQVPSLVHHIWLQSSSCCI